MTRYKSLLPELTSIVAGFVATSGALALGFLVGGPLLRWIWGPPAGFGEDYTTWQNFVQATIAQALFVIPAFAVCGMLLQKLWPNRPGWRAALLIANPLNVFAGYWFYYKLLYTGQNLHVELLYFGVSGAMLWSLMSVVALAPITFAGLRFRRESEPGAA